MIESSSKMLTIWLGTRAVDAKSLESIVPIDLIISCDYGSDVAEIEKNIPVFSVEKNTGVKHSWNNFHLNYLFDDKVATFLMEQIEKQKPDHIQFLCYSSSIMLEKFTHTFNLPSTTICLPSEKKNIFDDKIMLDQWQKWLKLPVIPSGIELLGNIDFSTLDEKYGNQLVLKLPVGSAGGKVYFVEDHNGLSSLQSKYSSSHVLIQKYVPGFPVNLQGVIAANEVSWAPPSIQIIGPIECTNNKFEWCGNDWNISSYLSKDDITNIVFIAEEIAKGLISHEYLGIIGLDFLLDNETRTPYLIEINPRFQGSTALLSQLELLNDSYPLVAKQINAFAGYCPFPTTSSKNVWPYFDVNGSQVILHNKNRFPVKVTSSLPFGVYSFDIQKKKIIFKRNGFTLHDCKAEDEVIISGGVPINGQVIMPGAPMLWIQLFGSALQDPLNGYLNNRVKEICREVNKMIICEPL